MSSRPHVTFGPDTVTKTGAPAALALEMEKMISAREIGKESGLFRVPLLIDFDEDKGILVQERLHGFTGMQSRAVASLDSDDQIWRRIGGALSTIHGSLQPKNQTDPDQISVLPGLRGPHIWVHGDFNLVNVGTVGPNDELAVLDWSVSAMVPRPGEIGPASFDLGWLVKSFFFVPNRSLFPRDLAPKIEALFAGYAGGPTDLPPLEDIKDVALWSGERTCELQAQTFMKSKALQLQFFRLARFLDSDRFHG